MSFGRQRHPHVHFNISQYYIYLLVIWEMSTLGKIFIAPLWRIRLFNTSWCNFQNSKTIMNEFSLIVIIPPSYPWIFPKVLIWMIRKSVITLELLNLIYKNIKSLTTVNWHGETYGNGGIYLWRCCWGCILFFLFFILFSPRNMFRLLLGRCLCIWNYKENGE